MSRIRHIALRTLCIPFTRSFRHASAERSETATVWAEVTLESGASGTGESCPREYVTGESLETAQVFCAHAVSSLQDSIRDLDSLRAWMASRAADIDRNPAAWCAIELALLDAFAKEGGRTVEDLLSLPPVAGEFVYTAVVGDAPPESFKGMVDEYRRAGFSRFKVKLSGDLNRDRAKMAPMRSLPAGVVRADANNLWKDADEAITFLQSLNYPFVAVEEPVRPNEYDGMACIGEALGCQIVLDESLLRLEQLTKLRHTAARWLVNVRVSKMGGLLRSLAVVNEARAGGIGIVVGAQVGETSLLTRAALPVAAAAQSALVAHEGAFGTNLLTRDVCEPPLMFGRGGVLRTAAFPMLRGPGWGIV